MCRAESQTPTINNLVLTKKNGEHEKKERVRAVFCDHLSVMRGKDLRTTLHKNGETRFCQAVFAVDLGGEPHLEAPGAKMNQGMPDMELRWDKEDVHNGWNAKSKIVVGDLHDSKTGNPLKLCPRGALKRAVAAWQAKGLNPKVGIELECYALQKDKTGKLVPYDAQGGCCYGMGPFADPAGFTEDIWEAAEEAGFRIESMGSEFDKGQFEFALEFDDAVKAVDEVVLFRQMAREIAFKHGIILTFMPKPWEEFGGSGMHVNFSFTDKNGQNAFDSGDINTAESINDLMKQCIAGLLQHHSGLAGLIAPSGTSYNRLQPGAFSGFWKNWAIDHRNSTTRVSAEGGKASRLEHRMADASCNPYTAVAAILQAALLGVEQRYELPAMETGDGFVSTDATEGLASNLEDALCDLEADNVLCNAVGQQLTENHIFIKRREAESTASFDETKMLEYYAFYL